MSISRLRLAGCVFAAAIALGLAGCGSSLAPEEPVFVPPAPPPAVSTVVTLSVVDSNAGNLLTGATTTLTFGGTGASSLRNLAGAAVTSLTTTTGVAQVQLASGAAPSATAPLSFTVTAARSGNITVTEVVRLTSTNNAAVSVSMLPLQTTAGAVPNLPATAAAGNVTTATATTAGSLPANSGGNFVATAALPPTATQAATVTATVSVPPTVTATVNGTTTPAAVGNVAAQIVVVDPAASSAVSVLPTAPAAPVTGTVPATLGTPASVAKIVLTDSAGNVINRFSAPITLTLDMPASTVNPDTGLPFALNATLPIFTFNEATGGWVPKTLANGTAVNGTVTAIDANSGTRRVSFQVDSLTFLAPFIQRPSCSASITVNPASAPGARTASYTIDRSGVPIGADIFVPAGSTAAIQLGPFAIPTSGTRLVISGPGVPSAASNLVCGTNTVALAAPPATTASITTQVTINYVPPATAAPGSQCTVTSRVAQAAVTVTGGSQLLGSGTTPSTGSLTLSGLPTGTALSVAATLGSGTALPTQTVTLATAGGTTAVNFTTTETCSVGTGGTGGG